MPWFTPETWTPGSNDQPTTTQFNKYLRDNPNYLLSGRASYNTQYLGTGFTSSSTTFAAVSTTNARISINSASSRVRGFFQFTGNTGFSSAGVAYVNFTVYLNGTTNLGDATLGLVAHPSTINGGMIVVPFFATGLTPGNNTFDLYWKLTVVSGSGWAMNILCTSATNGNSPILRHAIEC